MMADKKRLSPSALYRRCDLEAWGFETSAEIEPLQGAVGQGRAEEALEFGIHVDAAGYNLYAMGPPRLGKHAVIEERLREAASTKTAGSDWCYLANFEEARQPCAVCLPPGRGRELEQAMKALIEDLSELIPSALRAEEYQTSQQSIEERFRQRQEEALESVREKAARYDIAVIRTPTGVVMAPMEDGEVVGPAEFQERPGQEREEFEGRLHKLHKELASTMTQIPDWERERKKQARELEKITVRSVVRDRILELRAQFVGLDEVTRHLSAVEDDIVEERRFFMQGDEEHLMAQAWMPAAQGAGGDDWRRRYAVNVLIDHAKQEGAPVIREHHPTLENLVGRIDHEAQMGALTTDFTMIRAGALHKANGGYLILDARDVLRQLLGWEQLKQMMRSEEVRIETPGQVLGVLSTISMEPEPIPLDVKVVLVGDRMIYELLQQLDPDFDALFKVVVDFEEDARRGDNGGDQKSAEFLQLLVSIIGDAGLRTFDKPALARVVEEASRMAGDSRKVSLQVEALRDLLTEAAHFAGSQGRDLVGLADVQQALEARRNRRGRLHERRIDAIEQGELAIDLDGGVVGQVNGLSVWQQGGWRFGMPSRITASVRMGRGEVVDIEREVEMGGPIHSKGVLILNGYLGSTFGTRRPLSLAASLVFEQNYGGVDGDSASLAELVALLSALASHPVRQDLGITGSIDQRGKVQAVGGINEKIEGFFDVCTRLGRTGDQGVVIPRTNAEHLMLREDVVEAVESEDFSMYAVDTIEEAAELLTGVAPGAPDEMGEYDGQSLFGKVGARLERFAEARRHWNGGET